MGEILYPKCDEGSKSHLPAHGSYWIGARAGSTFFYNVNYLVICKGMEGLWQHWLGKTIT
jgi:hypothetical protein